MAERHMPTACRQRSRQLLASPAVTCTISSGPSESSSDGGAEGILRRVMALGASLRWATMPGPDVVALAIESAGRAAIAGELARAAEIAYRIDAEACREDKAKAHLEVGRRLAATGGWTPAVQGQQGRSPSQKTRLAVYERDGYTCRYAHCGRFVVDERVVAALSALIPDALAYHPNWRNDRCHPLLWTHVASLEHVQPWSLGGGNDLENLITTCSRCNYAKNSATIDQLGWTVRPCPEVSDWDGLLHLLPGLRISSHRLADHPAGTDPAF